MTVGRGGIGASVGRVPMLAYLCGTPVLARRYLDISNEQQKARDQTLPVDTANFANEFDDGAPPPSPLVDLPAERASVKRSVDLFYFIKYSSWSRFRTNRATKPLRDREPSRKIVNEES